MDMDAPHGRRQKHREKAQWELHMNAACYFEQIQEPTAHKTAAVQSPASHLTNHSSKANKICGTLLEKPERVYKQRCLMDS